MFRIKENYAFFLTKYRFYMDDYFDSIAYCLMPTHFHFLVRVKEPKIAGAKEEYSGMISKKVGTLLNSYTQAFNKMWNRHGNLFSQKTNAKLINDESYFIALAFYIHQNPVRSGNVESPHEWDFSSYQDYIDFRQGTLPNKKLILSKFSKNKIIEMTNQKIISPESFTKRIE